MKCVKPMPESKQVRAAAVPEARGTAGWAQQGRPWRPRGGSCQTAQTAQQACSWPTQAGGSTAPPAIRQRIGPPGLSSRGRQSRAALHRRSRQSRSHRLRPALVVVPLVAAWGGWSGPPDIRVRRRLHAQSKRRCPVRGQGPSTTVPHSRCCGGGRWLHGCERRSRGRSGTKRHLGSRRQVGSPVFGREDLEVDIPVSPGACLLLQIAGRAGARA